MCIKLAENNLHVQCKLKTNNLLDLFNDIQVTLYMYMVSFKFVWGVGWGKWWEPGSYSKAGWEVYGRWEKKHCMIFCNRKRRKGGNQGENVWEHTHPLPV